MGFFGNRTRKRIDDYFEKTDGGCYVGSRQQDDLSQDEQDEIYWNCRNQGISEVEEIKKGWKERAANKRAFLGLRKDRYVKNSIEQSPFNPQEHVEAEAEKMRARKRMEEKISRDLQELTRSPPPQDEKRMDAGEKLSVSGWARKAASPEERRTLNPTLQDDPLAGERGISSSEPFLQEEKLKSDSEESTVQSIHFISNGNIVQILDEVSKFSKTNYNNNRKELEEIKFETSEKRENRSWIDEKKLQPKSLLNNLTDSEQEFYFEVLLRGEKNGKWQIDQKVMGGGIMQRGELGFDFRIYNDSGEAKIEHKFFHSLRITHDQARLFNNFPDTKISATRLIGLKYTSTPEDIVTIIFWTPKFLKSFPRENITESITKYRKTGIEGEKIEVEEIFFRISLEGLWNCFEKSTFTKLTGNYKGETLKQLLETPNFTIAKVLRGEFGMLNAKYKRIPKILAYDIIYKKLVYLMENLGEDVNNSYPPCRPKSEWKEFDNILKAGVVAMLESTYRLAYVSDMVEYLGLYPRLKPYLKKEKGTFYIKFNGEYLSRVVSNRLVIWSGSAGFLVRVKPHPKYHDYGYGLKGQKYIPLTRLASLALDHLEMGWLHGNKPASLKKTDAISKLPFCTTYPEIAWAANKPENVIRHLYIESVRKELMKHGLASFTTAQQESDGIISSRIGRRVIVCLERRGGEYITRTGEFEIIKE